MLTHLKHVLGLALLCFTLLAQADIQRLQTLHELRSEGYVAATYILLDNNLFERVREPANREAYNAAMRNMEQLMHAMGNPMELRIPYDEFLRLVRQLESQDGEEAHFNLATVNQIMMAHAAVDHAIAREYEKHREGAPEKLLALHQQSLDTNQILLLYQNNMFSSVGVYFVEPSEGLFEAMNNRIVERADHLRVLFPEQAQTFNQLDKQYSFIQPRLLNYHSGWVPSIATFYLLRNTVTLNDLSRQEATNAAS
ncbi:hypothetical protein [Pseudomonas sp.]|uniref:hypothetical protein n=1 Tax=Pseudomonas sp. TaxID=306 RepID=UPI00272AD5F5|nr:hypothetical protein [Pseudomonas sp.]